MSRGGKLKERIVIDINTAERIGYVTDVEFNELSGKIEAIIVRRYMGLLSSIFGLGERSLPWECIAVMGREFILVKTFEFNEKCLKNETNCGRIV